MLFDFNAWRNTPHPELDEDKIQQTLQEVDACKLREDLFSSNKIVVEPSIQFDLELLIDRHLSRLIPVEIICSSLTETSASYGNTVLVDKEAFCDRLVRYMVALELADESEARHLSTVVTATYGTTASEGFRLHTWRHSDIQAKYWVSSRDDKVRRAHSVVDGLQVDLDAPFEFGGDIMRYPGDPGGSFDNVIGCRCSMLPA